MAAIAEARRLRVFASAEIHRRRFRSIELHRSKPGSSVAAIAERLVCAASARAPEIGLGRFYLNWIRPLLSNLRFRYHFLLPVRTISAHTCALLEVTCPFLSHCLVNAGFWKLLRQPRQVAKRCRAKIHAANARQCHHARCAVEFRWSLHWAFQLEGEVETDCYLQNYKRKRNDHLRARARDDKKSHRISSLQSRSGRTRNPVYRLIEMRKPDHARSAPDRQCADHHT